MSHEDPKRESQLSRAEEWLDDILDPSQDDSDEYEQEQEQEQQDTEDQNE